STNQMAEFGSLAAGTPNRYTGATITPTIVQALSNYLTGWFAAVVGGNSAAIEDMNALCYLFAYQLAYLLQAGVPEWDSGTTYYSGDLVQSSGTVYRSISNTNLNNNPTTDTGTNWGAMLQNGMITPTTLPVSTTVVSGQTLSWPNLTIPNAVTLTVNSGGYFSGIHPLTVSSGGTL